jgi:DNA (cytosine-5)-methyltransferase 1
MFEMEPKAISLFSGAGGMDIGILQAGFDILASIEKDRHCCSTLRSAIEREARNTLVIEDDINNVEPQSLRTQLGLAVGELDLLFGGPPCQPFSQIGKQLALDDERGLLLFQIIRFAEVFQPRAILIEQVKGLLSAKDALGKKGGVFAMLLNDLEQLGYIPKWKIINSADYGLPQLRKRVFIVATKKPNGFKFPDATHSLGGEENLFFSLKPYVSAGDVIVDLGKPSTKGSMREDSHIDVTPDGDRFRINGVPEGSYLAAQSHLPKEQVKNLTKKDTTKFLRVSTHMPSNTLRCGEVFFHPIENRYLTPREYMRIHGFPDEYILKGPIRGRSGRVRDLDQYRQIANSVPPPIAKLLAEKIMETIICQESLSYSDTH